MGEKSDLKLMYSLDGKKFKPLESILDLPDELETFTLDDQEAFNETMKVLNRQHTVTIRIDNSHLLTSKILYVLAGKSNNWLRRHGIPMRRKAYLKRRKT